MFRISSSFWPGCKMVGGYLWTSHESVMAKDDLCFARCKQCKEKLFWIDFVLGGRKALNDNTRCWILWVNQRVVCCSRNFCNP